MQLPHLAQIRLPAMHLIAQQFPGQAIGNSTDLDQAVRITCAATSWQKRYRGKRVALAVGSRGIANLDVIVRSTVAQLKSWDCQVFIIPAMGSHGGATAEGQLAILQHLGISEAAVGCPIISSMATQRIAGLRWNGSDYTDVGATTSTDLELHADAAALAQADVILPIVRIKPHTGFRGALESGICKMLAIGVGKHESCSRLHREGYGRFAQLIPTAGQALLRTNRFMGALAVIENGHDRTMHIEAVEADQVLTREPQLLMMAKQHMPRLPFNDIDVLIVERIGKDISGTGMDPNITGRSELGPMPGYTGPHISRIVVLGLTAAANGNASGLGLADLITEACFAQIDRTATAVNVLTSGSLHGGRIPVALSDEAAAIAAAATCVPGRPANQARIVRIRSTLELTHVAVSENVLSAETPSPFRHCGPFNGVWPD